MRRLRVRNLPSRAEQTGIPPAATLSRGRMQNGHQERGYVAFADEGEQVCEVSGVALSRIAESGAHGACAEEYERALSWRID